MDRPLLIAASYAQLYLRASARPAAELLAGTGLSEEDLQGLDYLEYQTMARVMHNIEASGAAPGWAARIGAQLNVSTHGPLGFAALSAPTLGSALAVMAEFHAARITTLAAELGIVGKRLRFAMRDLSGDAEFARFTLEANMRILQALIETVIGHATGQHMQVSFRHPDPGYATALADIYGAPVTFSADFDGISIPASWRDIRSPLYDASSYRANCAKCRELMAGLLPAGDTAQQVANLLSAYFEQVKAEGGAPGSPPDLQRVAAQLHMTPRTLIRRLHARGTRYRALLDGARLDCARELLGDARLTIADIAERLGYSDTANFTRAFRRLCGVSPGAWRRGRRTPGEGPGHGAPTSKQTGGHTMENRAQD